MMRRVLCVLYAATAAVVLADSDAIRPAGKFPVLAPSAGHARRQGQVSARTLFGLVERDGGCIFDEKSCPSGSGCCFDDQSCCGSDLCVFDDLEVCCNDEYACFDSYTCCGTGCMPKGATCCDDGEYSYEGQSGCTPSKEITIHTSEDGNTRQTDTASTTPPSGATPTSLFGATTTSLFGGTGGGSGSGSSDCGSSGAQKVLHGGAADKGGGHGGGGSNSGGSSGDSSGSGSSIGDSGGSGSSSSGGTGTAGCASSASLVVLGFSTLIGTTFVGSTILWLL